ncbi:MAG: hypothetical protein CL904_01725 [Dehalococcoidia bacterium]|nr:hypothetical protein [Dehalococcoidia bacterium]MQG16558.1 DNA polymerase III subunit gamma/tau [SAR202 cluster bacterium]|tara:strand:- start:7131 stop:8798 length:1668 start_codon:yes stop_codon:yes gene_type:complete
MTEVLYRKWRPKQFADIVGQPHVVQTLSRAVQSERLAHAYLFCGPRGTGKTSTARILAKSINCETKDSCDANNSCRICNSIDNGFALDLIEIDAASNRGIDDIRDLREKARYAPNEASHKIYIIDEAHMLTDQAFNALLKTLEEPPDNVIFILATTESHKIPPTILSRCQRYDFARITAEVIFDRLAKICKTEQFDVEPDALSLISNLSNGALRDAINILEQSVVSDDPPISETNVRKLMDIGDEMISVELTKFLLEKNIAKALETVNTAANSGTDLRYIHMGLIKYLRAVLLVKSNINIKSSYSEEMYKVIESISQNSELDSILNCLKTLTNSDLKPDSSNPLSLELAIVESGTDVSSNKNKLDEDNLLENTDNVSIQLEQRAEEEKDKKNVQKLFRSKAAAKPAYTKSDEIESHETKNNNLSNKSQSNETLENGWQAILDSLRYTKGQKFNLKALLVTCTSRKLVNDSIILGFSHPSHRERMEHELTIPESRKLLSDSFEKIMSKRYELILEKENVYTEKDKMSDELGSPLIRAAQSMGAQIIEQSTKRDLDN